MDPRHGNAHYFLGQPFEDRDRERAIQHYAAALAASPQHGSALAAMARFAVQVRGELPATSSSNQSTRASVRLDKWPAASPSSPVRPPHEPSSWTRSVVGGVENFGVRTEAVGSAPMGMAIWTFRVRAVDHALQPTGEVAQVTFRGMRIRGAVQNGDRVEIPRDSQKRGGYAPKRFTNLTTGEQPKARRWTI